jgi:hypothetical protein
LRLPGAETCDPPEDEFTGVPSVSEDSDDQLDGDERREADPYWKLRLDDEGNAIEAEFSPASERIYLIEPGLHFQTRFDRYQTSLKVKGVSHVGHDQAMQLLERLSADIFFELNVRYNVNLELASLRDRRLGARRRTGKTSVNRAPKLPSRRYPRDAVLLYSYGRAALGVPLLEYLAYYQVLEYFFPSYGRDEVIRRVRTRLLDPRFDTENDGDMAAIVTIASSYGRGYLKENEQLRATVTACTDEDDLAQFLNSVPERAEFLAKKDIAGVRQLILRPNQPSLVDQVAERVYGIRCRIVHSKEGGGPADVEALLPFSSEAQTLEHDIELIRHLAERAIMSNSSKADW